MKHVSIVTRAHIPRAHIVQLSIDAEQHNSGSLYIEGAEVLIK